MEEDLSPFPLADSNFDGFKYRRYGSRNSL